MSIYAGPMPRAIRVRLIIHGGVLSIFAVLLIYCLTPPGSALANSTAYVSFVSNLAIVYSAAAAIEAMWAGRKADPDDPA